MEVKEMAAQKVRSKYYDKIIQVNVPVRFYWAEDGFDGIEFGPFMKPVPQYQIHLITDALTEIMKLMETEPTIHEASCSQRKTKQNKPTQIPQVYIDAFKKEELP